MSDNLSMSSSIYAQTYQNNLNDPTTVNATATVDNEWTDDSISSLFTASSPTGKPVVFNGLPNAPKLPTPNQSLASKANFKEPQQAPSQSFFKAAMNQAPSQGVLNQAYDQAFEQLVKDLPNAAELLFAHYNSAPGTPKTPEEEQAYQQVLAQFNITSFDPVPNKADYTEQANLAYNDEFASALENQKPPLSSEQKAQLTYLHYNPDATFPGSDALKGQLQQLEKEAGAETAKKFGIPLNPDGSSSIPLKGDGSMYEAGLNGYYQEQVTEETDQFLASNPLKEDGSAWTAQDKQSLQQALSNPKASVPDYVAKAAASIQAAALAQFNTDMNLEGVGFVPAPAGTYPPLNPMVSNTVNEAQNILTEGQAVVNAIPLNGPNGPLKNDLLNILNIISAALSGFKQSLYEGQGVTSDQAQQYAKAKLDINLNQIKKNAEQAKKAAQAADKMASMGIFGKIFKFIINLLLFIVAAVTYNPALAAVAMMGMIDAVNPDLQVYKKAFDAIAAVVAKLAPYLPKKELTLLQDFAKFAFICAAGPFALLCDSSDLLTNSNIIRDLAMISGKSEDQADAIQQNAIMGISLAVTAIMIAIAVVFTGGAALMAVFPEIAAMAPALADAVASVTELGGQMAGRAGQLAEGALSAANDAASATQSGLQVGQSLIQRNLALITAKFQADQQMSTAEIDNLQKLIKKLLSLLTGGGDAINFIGSIQRNVLQSLSETTTTITSTAA